MNASCSAYNITNIPEEILIEIILYLNAKERLSLADSCRRFRTLVFEDHKLLRDLDFSNGAYLTTPSDVYRYFKSVTRSEQIRNLNLRNVNFARPRAMFSNYINKAINLVEINIHGVTIEDTWPFTYILRSFPHVKRLSVDWPRAEGFVDSDAAAEYLREQFSKLVYLSVRLLNVYFTKDLYHALIFCQELKELHVTVMSSTVSFDHTTFRIQFKKLEIFEYYGPNETIVAGEFVSTLLHPEEWTYFQLSNPLTSVDGFCLERNLVVCNEMLESKSLKRLSCIYPQFASKLGGFVISGCLLEEVMKITQRNLPGKFSSFSTAGNKDGCPVYLPPVLYTSKLWMLKIEEARRLLKDPRYQISYLDIRRNIDEECDAHIVTSAFPSLTEIILSKITKRNQKTSTRTLHPDIQPGRRAVPDELDELDRLTNPDTCFSKLVEGTPHVRHLTVIPSRRLDTPFSNLEKDETWDLTALHLISRWKNLTTLRLRHIPIVDGKFLIEIGKQCRNLENLELHNLGPNCSCCYTNELLRMLFLCRNLREFTLRQNNIGHLLDLFLSLSNNPELRRVCIESNSENETVRELKQPIEELVHHCSKLTKFVCSIGMSQADSNELRYILERLESELERKIFLDIS